MTIRLLRIATGRDGQSHFTEGMIAWAKESSIGSISAGEPVSRISFEESPAGSRLDWHNAPCRQYVLTLAGTLEFENRAGERVVLKPGDVLLAEDTTGGGHRWRLIDDAPWRRVYVELG